MTSSTHHTTGSIAHRTLAGLLFTLALTLVPSTTRGDINLQVNIAQPTSANESNRTAFLTWTADADNIYRVQSSTNISDPTAWTTEDAVSQSSVGSLKWMAPEALKVQKYYRLILPQSQIFSVEPAVVTPGVPVDLYVLGQFSGSNMVLQINGVTQSNAVVVSSSLATVPSFTPDVPGTYHVSLVVSGSVVSSFNVTCADALVNPELVLQGPPTEPPASPSKKGGGAVAEDCDDNDPSFTLLMPALMKAKEKANQTKCASNLRQNPFTGGACDDNDPSFALLMPALMKAKEKANQTKCASNLRQPPFTGGDCDDNDPSFTLLMPALMKAKEKANRCRMISVQPFSGEVQECDVDLVIPGRGLDFVWARTYHSRLGRFNAYGTGWTFSYDVHCAQNSSGGMDVYDGTGRKDTYTLGANGVYTCPEFFREGTLSNNTFTLTFADTSRWVFNPFDGSAAAGRLTSIVDRNGNTMLLNYDTSGRLAQVVDDLGRTNMVAYNTAGQLASVTDFSGRTVTYQYYQGLKADNGGAGDLASVTSPPVTSTPNGNDFPNGKTTTYTYSKSFPVDRENHLLLTVTNPDGQSEAVFSYEHSSISTNYLRCIAAQEGTNTASRYNWVVVSRPAGSYATLKCIVNDPVGNVTECFFDARNRCVIEDDYTGRCTPGLPVTDTVNRPTGKVRSSDPDYYEARADWNNDSLCRKLYLYGGQQVQCVYQSDFDPATTARKRADLRVVRELATGGVDLDGDGVADVTDRSWHFDYDSRFGSNPTTRDYCVQYRESDFARGIIVCKPAGGTSGNSAGRAVSRSKSFYQWIKASYDRLVPVGNGVAIKTKGTGAEANRVVHKGWDGTIKGLIVPDGNGMAIKTKGTGADNNRVVHKGWDGTIKGLITPDGNGMAIKTKGTGADNNRVGHKGWDGTIKGFVATAGKLVAVKTISWSHDDESPMESIAGFVTSATDPRGNLTTGTYDATGNRVKVQFHWDRQSSADRDFTYDPNGQCVAITNTPDANGRRSVDTFSWSQGQLTQCVVDASGLALTSAFEYDPRGNLTRYVDPRTNDWLFAYNSLNQIVQSSSATLSLCFCKIEMRYAYDANDNLVQCATDLRDATGTLQGSRTDNFRYDGLDRLSETALAVDAAHALTNRFVYDGNNECVQVLGGDAVSGADSNQTMAYQYDERGLLFREIAAPGSGNSPTNEYDYNPNGQTARVNKIEAIVIKQRTFAYDGFGRLSSITDPMGNQTTFNFDANDNLKDVRLFGEMNDVPGSAGNVRLAESSYEYDGLDRCVVRHDLHFNPATQSLFGDECRTTFAYAPNDECVSMTDTLGHTTSYGYDTACRPVSVTDALGNQLSVVYDACDNPLTLISSEQPAAGGKPQVFSVTKVYDSLNRCVSTTDSAGNTSSCAYDSLNRCVQTVDARGTLAFYSYDLLDRCTVTISDLNQDGLPDFTHDITTTFTWSSSSGNLLATTDSNTNTTSYTYDSLGRCIAVTHADGTQEQLVWSPHSNLLSAQDANGTTITNTYDLCDRVVHRDIAARNVLASTTFETFAFDGCGRLIGATNDNTGSIFAYDSLGECVSETLNGLATISTYDALGNRLSLTYPGGRTLAYTYDTLNRCASVTDSGQLLASYAYDGPGRVSRITYGNGTRMQITYDGLAGVPNAQGDHGFGQVSRVRHAAITSGAVIDDRTFGYDSDQNKTARNMTSPFTLGGAAQAMSFQYDPACRLINSFVTTNGAVARMVAYNFDRMGNRTNVTGTFCSGDYAMISITPPADFQMNQYTATPCDTRTYDDNGNLVSIGSPIGLVTYQYDYADRLVQVQALDSGTGTMAPLSSYTYDALGRRVSKTVYSGGLPPITSQFLYLDGEVIEERNGGVTTATYVRTRRFGAGLPAPQPCLGLRTSGHDYFVHTDDQGNSLALSDSTGAVVERYDYDDYGTVTFLTSDGTPTGARSSSFGNVYCWGGQRLDPETGLHNNDNGDYFEPQTGRAIRGKVKAIKDMGGSGFTGNNPWSGGSPCAMQKGTVKFFNETKGFGMVVGGSDGGVIGLSIDINALTR